MQKRRNGSLGAISPLFHNILLPFVRFMLKKRTIFSLWEKRLYEISEIEITRVSCICYAVQVDDYIAQKGFLHLKHNFVYKDSVLIFPRTILKPISLHIYST